MLLTHYNRTMRHFFMILWVFGTIMSICLVNPTAYAQTITPAQNLNFGEAVVLNNNAQHSIVVDAAGMITNSPDIVFITTPVQGVYNLTGADPNADITINVTRVQNFVGPGEDFILDSFDVTAPTSTDNSGNATIFIGARLQTTGTGIAYTSNQTFTAQLNIDITFTM